jgi:hypothetical protein
MNGREGFDRGANGQKRQEPGTATECRSCQALIVWAKSANGKSMPMDVEPDAEGQFFLFRKEDCIDAVHQTERSTRAEGARQRGDKKYTCHFATCPNAAEHRSKK